jgi:hypothetical protein
MKPISEELMKETWQEVAGFSMNSCFSHSGASARIIRLPLGSVQA